MQSFRDWIRTEHADDLGPPPGTGIPGTPGPAAKKPFDTYKTHEFKPWRASKDDIIQHWNALRPDQPIVFDAISSNHKGSTFGEDGIRLTGSKRFIDGVLGRLKDLLSYEGPNTKLDLVYRQTQYKSTDTPDKSASFVFYIQVREKKPEALSTDMVGDAKVDGAPLPGMPPKLKLPKLHKSVEPEIGDASGGPGLI